ncbi:MAG: 30S ribosomal protein S1 [Alphaproteobacteria bacterium]|jgi:small subunit ribosomal protein S1|nr:30S ribosomal protein S1 [Alphaproteobacteria bacterium]MBT7943295.1 30S ribosomal protein S1 [Alphaproteobacteria bacterium]
MAPATQTAEQDSAPATKENFAEMLEESLGPDGGFEGHVVTGTILAVENDDVLIDVGLKSEGRVSLKEFGTPDETADIKTGDTVDVFVERYEDKDGIVRLSREKARREEAWTELEKSFKKTERVNGVIFGRVKGGFIVDLSGAVAFLPGSQVDIRPVRDIGPLMNTPQPFQILKMDPQRNNIVVSRRAVLEETRSEARSELISNLSEGQVLEGVVKNITDYGAFVDLGGVDGLLHVTDIAWRRVNHPSEVLQIGQTMNVQVIRFNAETQRISLGLKQLEIDPWEGVEAKYPPEAKFTGRVTNITDYGAFVELEPGVEGLVHVSEMSWTKKNVHPGKIVSTSQEVEVMVLNADPEKRRISLGLKQCQSNPWEGFMTKFTVGSEVEGEIKNITEFGLFIGLDGEIDGMAHLSDLSWAKTGEEALADYNKGDMVKAKVLDVDVEKERISLGIKQLTEDTVGAELDSLKKGDVVTCTITNIVGNGIEVTVNDNTGGFIRKGDLSRDRSEQRPDRFAAGEKIDAKITQIDKTSRKLTLSVKALEVEEEKKAMKAYGSSDAGASLGDILGAAFQKKAEESDGEEETKEKPKAKPAKKAAKEESAGDAKEEAKEEKPKKAPAKKAAKKDEADDVADDKAEKKKAAPKKKAAAKAKDDDKADDKAEKKKAAPKKKAEKAEKK